MGAKMTILDKVPSLTGNLLSQLKRYKNQELSAEFSDNGLEYQINIGKQGNIVASQKASTSEDSSQATTAARTTFQAKFLGNVSDYSSLLEVDEAQFVDDVDEAAPSKVEPDLEQIQSKIIEQASFEHLYTADGALARVKLPDNRVVCFDTLTKKPLGIYKGIDDVQARIDNDSIDVGKILAQFNLADQNIRANSDDITNLLVQSMPDPTQPISYTWYPKSDILVIRDRKVPLPRYNALFLKRLDSSPDVKVMMHEHVIESDEDMDSTAKEFNEGCEEYIDAIRNLFQDASDKDTVLARLDNNLGNLRGTFNWFWNGMHRDLYLINPKTDKLYKHPLQTQECYEELLTAIDQHANNNLLTVKLDDSGIEWTGQQKIAWVLRERLSETDQADQKELINKLDQNQADATDLKIAKGLLNQLYRDFMTKQGNALNSFWKVALPGSEHNKYMEFSEADGHMVTRYSRDFECERYGRGGLEYDLKSKAFYGHDWGHVACSDKNMQAIFDFAKNAVSQYLPEDLKSVDPNTLNRETLKELTFRKHQVKHDAGLDYNGRAAKALWGTIANANIALQENNQTEYNASIDRFFGYLVDIVSYMLMPDQKVDKVVAADFFANSEDPSGLKNAQQVVALLFDLRDPQTIIKEE